MNRTRGTNGEIRPTARRWLVGTFLVVVLVALPTGAWLVTPVGQRTASLAADSRAVPAGQSCTGPAPNASDPSAIHGLYVLAPPRKPQGLFYSEMKRYLVNNSIVCGADLWVHWSDIDRGPSVTPRYNWSSIDQAMLPWVQAGKRVNLIFWAVGYGPGATYVPSYVLSQVPTIQCGRSPVTPLFWNDTYVRDLRGFIRAVVHHVQNDSSVGYLRFGLGTGGETLPLIDSRSAGCRTKLFSSGYTVAGWDTYLFSMMDFERSLHSSHRFMVALDGGLGPKSDDTYADIAGRATRDGIGFGTEGLWKSSATWNSSNGRPTCAGGGFCSLFTQYSGRVPLEVQTLGPSSPAGYGLIGSLVPLLRYSLDEHAQVFEVYLSDWLTAFDPFYPTYLLFHHVYGHELKSLARVVG